MSRKYSFSTETGSSLLPVADGEFVLNGVSADFSQGQIHLRFLDADGMTLVTPSAGTVAFTAGLLDGQFIAASSNGSVDATSVEAGEAAYTPPQFNGPVAAVKATLSGVTGASFVQIVYWAGGS